MHSTSIISISITGPSGAVAIAVPRTVRGTAVIAVVVAIGAVGGVVIIVIDRVCVVLSTQLQPAQRVGYA